MSCGCGLRLEASEETPEIIIGADNVLHMELVDACGKPFVDLTAATQIELILQNADLTFCHLKLTPDGNVVVTNGPFAKFDVLCPIAKSLLLKASAAGALSDAELHYTLAGKLTIKNLPQSIKVSPRQFPTS